MLKYRLVVDLQLFSQEKTEKATPKKRGDARNKGQVAKSQDLPSAVIITLVFASFIMFGNYYSTHLLALLQDIFQNWLLIELTAENLGGIFRRILVEGLLLLAPIFIIIIVIGVVSNVLQFGFLFTTETIKPSLKKLNPISGVKRLFSLKSLVELVKNLLKVSIVAFVVYSIIKGEWNKMFGLGMEPIETVVAYLSALVIRLGLTIGAILIVLALFDYMYQKYEHEKSIKMSKQDIKDERKNAEGDPLIKGKIRERQTRMAIARMMQEVPNADVVITNPTHFAVALKYDALNMDAPVVVAKGMDHLALKIKEVAKEHNVITMENKPLARALYSQTEIGDTIPPDLFQAVAEVLAYVYRIKGRASSKR